MVERQFRAGDVIFRPGDEGNLAYVVEQGLVAIERGSDGLKQQIAEIRPGGIFGEMSLIEERPRMYSARAIVDSTLNSLSRSDFEDLLFRDPERCRAYLKTLFERLRTLTSQRHQLEHQELIPAIEKPRSSSVMLFPLTETAAKSVAEEGLVLPFLPYRLGRASEAQEPEAFSLNEIWLLDAPPFNVSRNHATIEATADGGVQVSDRGSQLGTLVNDERIGGKSRKSVKRLSLGDNIIVLGSTNSPFQFRVVVMPPL